jgi:alkylresorcinol/alkylpyrone synthase
LNASIRSLATANPPRYVTGAEAFQFATAHFDLGRGETDLYRRLLLEGPIRGRYLGAASMEQLCEMSPDQQLARFREFGAEMAARAAREALAAADLAPGDIGGLVVNTCTGYLCPGLSSYLAEELQLEESVQGLDLMGMGCGAAIPNLRSAAGMLAMGNGNGSSRPVLTVAVEVCSATLFLGPDPGLIVSNCLFGDGAAAAVVTGDPASDGGALARLVDFESAILPAHREDLRYQHDRGRLRNVLTRRVPVIGARAVGEVTRRLLERHGLSPAQIDCWVVHPGGTAVLEQVQKELGVSREALRFSYEILSEYGNMSSPSVLFVLKRLLERGRPARGHKGLLLSFGAGFSAFAALVEF